MFFCCSSSGSTSTNVDSHASRESSNATSSAITLDGIPETKETEEIAILKAAKDDLQQKLDLGAEALSLSKALTDQLKSQLEQVTSQRDQVTSRLERVQIEFTELKQLHSADLVEKNELKTFIEVLYLDLVSPHHADNSEDLDAPKEATLADKLKQILAQVNRTKQELNQSQEDARQAKQALQVTQNYVNDKAEALEENLKADWKRLKQAQDLEKEKERLEDERERINRLRCVYTHIYIYYKI